MRTMMRRCRTHLRTILLSFLEFAHLWLAGVFLSSIRLRLMPVLHSERKEAAKKKKEQGNKHFSVCGAISLALITCAEQGVQGSSGVLFTSDWCVCVHSLLKSGLAALSDPAEAGEYYGNRSAAYK